VTSTTLLHWAPVAVPHCQLAESPRFAHGTWSWVDIQAKLFYTQTHGLLSTLPLPDEIGCVLPTPTATHYIALGRLGMWSICGTTIQHLLPPPFDSNTHRFNDGRADALGRIWVSTLVDARTPASAGLYCIEHGQAKLKVSGLIVGNGLAFSPDNQFMYLCDTRHRCVWRYEFDCQTGNLGERTVLKQYTEGTERPDGAACTTDGSYWVAIYEGYRLDRFSPEGELIEHIALPVARPTMPCFGKESGSVVRVCSAQDDSTHPNHPNFSKASVIACHTPWQGVAEAWVESARCLQPSGSHSAR
jgi:sugar lactone lactonase YvrE